jgi:hypothetical protein
MMDVLDTLKNKIGERQIVVNADKNIYVFFNLKTDKLRQAIGKKATRQAIDDIYEAKTGQSSKPGTGPADLIRGFAGLQPPKGTGRKTRRQRKRSRRNR